jgi:hypothetical protein
MNACESSKMYTFIMIFLHAKCITINPPPFSPGLRTRLSTCCADYFTGNHRCSLYKLSRFARANLNGTSASGPATFKTVYFPYGIHCGTLQCRCLSGWLDEKHTSWRLGKYDWKSKYIGLYSK